ncbi:hypothetical protein [Pontibaca methylaminivorans]|uniref:hypothetical protein n=1 Tax=Pontibaca methylaminivorans TaxID=515897 RepID=UPI002FD9F413
MAENDAGHPRKSAGQSRDQRLRAALKANMARRKAQARARAESGSAIGGGTTDDSAEPRRGDGTGTGHAGNHD